MGGVQQTVADLCHYIDNDRYLPTVCALEEDGAMGREIEGSGSKVFRLGLHIKHDRPRIIGELAPLMRRHRIDILHAAAYHPSLFGRLADLTGPWDNAPEPETRNLKPK